MAYRMHFPQPVSIHDVAEALSHGLGLGMTDYEMCLCGEKMEVKEPVLSPDSKLGNIFCLNGLGKKEGSDAYKCFEVDFNWNNPKNMPVVEKTDSYKGLLKIAENLLMSV